MERSVLHIFPAVKSKLIKFYGPTEYWTKYWRPMKSPTLRDPSHGSPATIFEKDTMKCLSAFHTYVLHAFLCFQLKAHTRKFFCSSLCSCSNLKGKFLK